MLICFVVKPDVFICFSNPLGLCMMVLDDGWFVIVIIFHGVMIA